MERDNDILVIPDVHGRRFWENAARRYPDADTIFLGDYHDPYPAENVSTADSLDNFINILDYARIHRDNVTLLLGNHDMHYISPTGYPFRYDYEHAAELHSLLRTNIDMMALAALRRRGDKSIVFSHAPILTDWIKAVGETDRLPLLVNRLNRLLSDVDERPWNCEDMLNHSSHYRSGNESFGSPIWADMREIRGNIIATADFSVFGHTQVKDAVITERWANLDCRKAFIITPEIRIHAVE